MRLFLSTLVLVLISSGVNAGTYHSGDKKKEKKKSYPVMALTYSIRQMEVHGLSTSVRKARLSTRLMLHYPKISLFV